MIQLRPPFSSLADNEVFAVDATGAQITVRRPNVAVGVIDVRVEDRVIPIELANGVGIATIEGLTPDAPFEIAVLGPDGNVAERLAGTSRPALTNPTKIATISDVHLGADGFGPARKILDQSELPYALRCGRSAVDEALAWGAEALIIKGDLTDTGARDEWLLAERLLEGVDVPVLITSGNHDVWGTREVMPTEGAESIGRTFDDVQTLDVGPLRIVLVDTSLPGRGWGDLGRHHRRVVDAVDAERPTLLCLHHHVQRLPAPWFWPPGISPNNATPVLEAVVHKNPFVFLTSGHTHRNRRHQLLDGNLTFTEVSATSDYPGVWAGYEVTGDVIRQTVRRIAAPEATLWTEATRAALGTVWPRWSQGRLDDRCVDVQARR